MTSLNTLLDRFRQTAASEREKGNYFERLVKAFLIGEPYYADLYDGKVWLWEDWRKEAAKRGNGDVGADAGIDLVAETITGELHAIQAKFYAEDASLKLDDFGTFFTASGKSQFSRRLIFLTATKSTHHLRTAVQDQVPPVNIVSLTDLENSSIDWTRYEPAAEQQPLKPKKSLRPHQVSAVDNVITGLTKADRGKLIMACGTGKTFTSLKIAERVADSGGRVLFLVPSLALLSQSLYMTATPRIFGDHAKVKDLTTIQYNSRITVTGIPVEAYEYVVNGKPAIEWVVERQCVKTDKDSGIVSDANDWATETMNNPRYPLELLLRVITVSLETMKIVKALPPLGEFADG